MRLWIASGVKWLRGWMLVLVLALTYVGNQVLFQSMDLYEKDFLPSLDVFLILVAIFFEVFRICNEEEQK